MTANVITVMREIILCLKENYQKIQDVQLLK